MAERFIEDFGLALASEGLSRTAGRLPGLVLMLDAGGALDHYERNIAVIAEGLARHAPRWNAKRRRPS